LFGVRSGPGEDFTGGVGLAVGKLLLDENLSVKLTGELRDVFPDIRHVREVGLKAGSDGALWEWAKGNGYAIVSKDSDFWHRSVLFGHPPKVIWLRVGNGSAGVMADVLRGAAVAVVAFLEEAESGCLVLGGERRGKSPG
jgi:predicted nuclease of predicted toxin-antitoxin system